MAAKVCRKCRVEKSTDEFHIARRNKDGLFAQCKDCRSEYAANDYLANPAKYEARRKSADPVRRRDMRLRRQYGITAAQYEELHRAQNGVCAVCGRPPLNSPLNVDHDHKTGLVRGLLCWTCNSRVIGAARDNAELLRSAAAYLDAPPAVRVLGEIFGRTGRINKRRRKKRPTKRKETIA